MRLLESDYFEILKDKDTHLTEEDETGYFNFPKEKIDLSGTTDSTNASRAKLTLNEGQLPSFWNMVFQKQWRTLLVVYPMFLYYFRFFNPMFVLFFGLYKKGISYALGLLKEYLLWRFNKIFLPSKSAEKLETKSLRKIVKNDFEPIHTDLVSMEPLRQGR